jgi:hypothetical protein
LRASSHGSGTKLFAYLADLGFAHVVRFRGNIHVTDASGETRTAANWVGRSGRARKLRGARVTASRAYQVGAVVCVCTLVSSRERSRTSGNRPGWNALERIFSTECSWRSASA